MARWQLTEPQYLKVPGIFWEQVTNDRVTQRPIRKQYPVPLFLDPRIETDWNDRDPQNPMDGRIIVAYAGSRAGPRDIIFEGPPNPGMLPIDDEAREITAKYTWTPTVDLSDEAARASHQAKILDGLIQRLAEANVTSTGGTPAGFEKLMESMAAMMQQQTQLLAMLLQKNQQGEFASQAQALGAEPPIAEEEPLDEASEPTQAEIDESAAIKEAADRLSKAKAEADLMRNTRAVAANGRRA